MKVLLGQHCVSELLENLLDILHEEMKKFGKKSIIKDLFSLELAQVIECDHCKIQSEVSEKHFVLNVPIIAAFGGRYQVNSEECIEDFMKAEKMTGSERYSCLRCCRKREATKWSEIVKLPKNREEIQLKWQENHHSCIFSNVNLGVEREQQVEEIFPSWCCNSPWRVSEVRPLHGLLQKCGH